MSNTSALREQSIEVIAMPNDMLKQCISACCKELWCKWDKISFQPEFSFKWSTKYLEKKKAFSYWLHQSLNKNVLCFFVCLFFFKKVYKPKTSYVWMVLQKEKKQEPPPPKKKQILVLFYGDLWKSWNLQPIFLPPRQNGDARCHCQDPVCESLFGLPSCALQKKGSSYVCKSTAWNKGRDTLRKGGRWEKCIRVDGSRHYRLFNDCPRKMKCSWCVCWGPPTAEWSEWISWWTLHVNGNLHACKWRLFMYSFILFFFSDYYWRFVISGANVVRSKSLEPMFSFSQLMVEWGCVIQRGHLEKCCVSFLRKAQCRQNKTIHFCFVILATRGWISEVGLNFLIGKL